MRNLRQYPVTVDEIVDLLTFYKDDAEAESVGDPLIGDMRPTLLAEAVKRVKASAYMITDEIGCVREV